MSSRLATKRVEDKQKECNSYLPWSLAFVEIWKAELGNPPSTWALQP